MKLATWSCMARISGSRVRALTADTPTPPCLLIFKPPVADIDYMKQQVGIVQFFHSGRKSFQQVFWQISYESDSIGYYDFEVSWESKPAACWVKSGKEFVFNENRAVGQRIQQG